MATTVQTEKTESAASKDDTTLKDLRLEVRALRGELKDSKEKMNALNTNYSKAQKKIAKLEAEAASRSLPKDATDQTANETTVNVSSAASTTPKTDSADHVPEHKVGWSPRFCPEHGCKNEGFVDETECRTCGLHLGSQEYVHDKLKACPNCAGTGAKLLPGIQSKYPAGGR